MKKLSVLLSAVLALALAVPAFAAAPELSFTGTAKFGLMYGENPNNPNNGYQLTGTTNLLTAKITLANVSGGDNPKVSVSFNVVAEPKKEGKSFGDGAFNVGNANLGLGISNVVFTFEGPFLKGGRNLTTQVGNLSAYKSDYVAGESDGEAHGTAAKSAKGDGIAISGFGVGPFDASIAYLFTAPDANGDRLTVTSLNGSLEVLDLGLTAASHYVGDTLVHDLHLKVGVEPAEGFSVTANYATDGRNDGYVYDVTGKLATLANLELTAGVRGIDQNAAWNPRFAKRHKDNCGNAEHLCAHDGKNGISLGLSTTQAGINLGLTYKTGERPTVPDDDETVTTFSAGTVINELDLSGKVTLTDKVGTADDSTKFEGTVKRSFGAVNASYKIETTSTESSSSMTHTIAADTTIDTPIADGVKISGQVKLGTAIATPEAHASVEWKAPMGLSLGVHYANYNRADHGPMPNGDPNDDGFYLTAGYEFNW